MENLITFCHTIILVSPVYCSFQYLSQTSGPADSNRITEILLMYHSS